MRLLLIDDEVRKAEPLINYFREICAWDVQVASDPDEALERLRASDQVPYEVIVLDVMMDPGKTIPREKTNGGRDTGLILLDDVCGLISEAVHVIVYSARTDLDYLNSDSRIALYIRKPTSARDIADAISDLLDRQNHD